ncbi:putative Band 4.1-like protein 1 [Hypsibius exemplaris]|uniref:Band 4.1-like protein 1 n=1 Tax=Hypsibius exemplaris TaxID=2072580 RepID=A0A1W0WG87_HYPEX|nr:putative Band 4.1-like protein 1 [Hypsibius exemplaris]
MDSRPILQTVPVSVPSGGHSVTTKGKGPKTTVPTAKPTGNGLAVRVILPGNEQTEFKLDKTASAQDLVNQACRQLGTEDVEFFGLYYPDKIETHSKWLKLDQPLKKQINRKTLPDLKMKFYPTPFTVYKSEQTKYLLCLQLQTDLVSRRLPAKLADLVVLGSLMVQMELGTFDQTLHHGNYIVSIQLAPQYMQTIELANDIMEKHRFTTSGMSKFEAVNQYLDYAQRLPLYGTTMFSVEDEDMDEQKMLVSYQGVEFRKNSHKVQTFTWPHILEIAYRRAIFCIAVRTSLSNSEEPERLIYRGLDAKSTKRMWQFCIDCHAFFRPRADVLEAEEKKLSRKSTFRLGKAKSNKTPAKTSVQLQAEAKPVEDVYAMVLPKSERPARNMNSASNKPAGVGENQTYDTIPADMNDSSNEDTVEFEFSRPGAVPEQSQNSTTTGIKSQLVRKDEANQHVGTTTQARHSTSERTHFPFPDPPIHERQEPQAVI